MIWILLGLLALLILFWAVILIRTALFRPRKQAAIEGAPCEFDREAAVRTLRELIRCRTVSRYTRKEEDDAEFERLVSLIPTLFPHLSAACPLTRFEGRGLLFYWKGKESGPATVLMAHYDVVPEGDTEWKHPPFAATVEDGILYGRGAVDTKLTFNAALFAVDHLIARGFVPAHDVYLAFSGSEEVNGRGAPSIVDHFHQNGIEVSLVLDEGGAVVKGAFPGVSAPTAMIGIAEKGMVDLEYRVRSSGGHASAPKPRNPIAALSRACCAVLNHPPRMHISKPVAEMFDTLGRHSSFFYRMIFANLWCFSPILNAIAKKQGGDMNALLRTTVAFTRMKGSDANNVLPQEATMVSNIRLNPVDTVDGTIAYLRRVIDDPKLELRPIQSTNPSRISTTDCEGYARVRAAVNETWPNAIVSPYLMVQCSDSRHWGLISDRVYRFSGTDVTAEERRSIHGKDEHIRTEAIGRTVEFYLRLLERS